MKSTKFETSEDFKNTILQEFLPLVQTLSPWTIAYSFERHPDLCEIGVQINQMQQKIITVYRHAITGEAEWVNGGVNKGGIKVVN